MYEHMLVMGRMSDDEKREHVRGKIKEAEAALWAARRDLDDLRKIERDLNNAAYRKYATVK